VKKLIKQILSIIKNRILSQNIINGTLMLGSNSTISDSKLEGSLFTGVNCIIKGVNFEGEIKVGNYTTLWGPNINLNGRIEIGSFCSLANNVSFFENEHNYKKITTYYIFRNLFGENENERISKGIIKLGCDVWVGSSVIILSGVSVGHGVVIAANSVVISDLPPYSICAGSPAKVIKFRFEDRVINRLLEIKWWEWDIDKIIMNKKIFEKELSWDLIENLK